MAWMRTKLEPGWEEWAGRWKAEQRDLAGRRVEEPLADVPRFVAGVDAAFSPDMTRVLAAAVVWDREEGRVVEVRHAVREAGVPYVPGFLSFREGPVVGEAVRKLEHPWGVICFDGQGTAHPRRCGLAVHMGVTLGVRAIGVAKSRLIGTYGDLAEDAGAEAPLMDKGEQVGVVLRTKDRCNPVFVSAGNRVDLESAVRVVRACVTKYRIPEPTRQADAEVGKLKRSMVGK
jgi:deoxyribonuclease V